MCSCANPLFTLSVGNLKVAFDDSLDGVSMQTRSNAHFKTRTKTSQKIVRELLFADDSALVAQNADNMQRLVDRCSSAGEQFSLKKYIKKTECYSNQ